MYIYIHNDHLFESRSEGLLVGFGFPRKGLDRLHQQRNRVAMTTNLRVSGTHL